MMAPTQDAFSRLVELINSGYQAGRKENGYLILDEAANQNKPGALREIQLFLRGVEKVVAFKFDQIISEERGPDKDKATHECFAPILSNSAGNRSMCDYIVFFQLANKPEIYTWAVNMKSKNLDNNVGQLRAARRVIEFLLGKLKDKINAETNKPADALIGQIDFVLFSAAKAQINASKSTTNLDKTGGRGSNYNGQAPEYYLNVLKPGLRLQPLARLK